MMFVVFGNTDLSHFYSRCSPLYACSTSDYRYICIPRICLALDSLFVRHRYSSWAQFPENKLEVTSLEKRGEKPLSWALFRSTKLSIMYLSGDGAMLCGCFPTFKSVFLP